MRDDQDKHSRSQMKHPSFQMKSEITAQQILKKLLADRSFQKYIIDSTVKEILNDVGSTDTTTYGQQLIIQNLEFQSSTSCRRAIIDQNIDLLICHLKLIAELFIKSSNLAFCDIGADINRDASALFSARLQLEQFVNSDRFQLPRFEQFVRRLYTLLRSFAARISTLVIIFMKSFFFFFSFDISLVSIIFILCSSKLFISRFLIRTSILINSDYFYRKITD
ncbi:unnamed protein product [Onchocerca flexuosa]|uniref:Uncharacterized protein n=1 Tax=Onchocerca flexuosa TaxID=387005 RepID=A0A183HI10_9BILA|nr:unnamed protein product [Onchocerca flexuosa]